MTDSDFDRSSNAILKRDAKGRVRTGARQRERLLDEFERSGLSGPEFSEVAGVCYQTFAGWRRQRRRARGELDLSAMPVPAETGPALVRWVEAEPPWPGTAGHTPDTKPENGGAVPLSVKLAGGLTMEVCHESQLSLVVELARRLGFQSSKPC